MNPIDILLTRFTTTRARIIAAASGITASIALIAAGFIPALAPVMITTFGAIAGVLLAASGILLAAGIPALSRRRYRLYTRRIASLSVFGGWIVLSSIISRNDVIAEHLGGALMVAVVIGLLAFSSKTEQEIAEDIAARENQATEDIFDSYESREEEESSESEVSEESVEFSETDGSSIEQSR